MKQSDFHEQTRELLSLNDERLFRLVDVVQGRGPLPGDNSVLEAFSQYEREFGMNIIKRRAEKCSADLLGFAIASALSNMITLYVSSLETLAKCYELSVTNEQHSVLKPIPRPNENNVPSAEAILFSAHERAIARRCYRTAIWLMSAAGKSSFVGVDLSMVAQAAAAFEMNRSDFIAQSSLRVACSLILTQLEYQTVPTMTGDFFSGWTCPSSVRRQHDFFIAELRAFFNKNKFNWFLARMIPLRSKYTRDQRLDWLNAMIDRCYMENDGQEKSARKYRIKPQ